MKQQRIVVAGGGFPGPWSAVNAARRREELALSPDAIAIALGAS